MIVFVLNRSYMGKQKRKLKSYEYEDLKRAFYEKGFIDSTLERDAFTVDFKLDGNVFDQDMRTFNLDINGHKYGVLCDLDKKAKRLENVKIKDLENLKS